MKLIAASQSADITYIVKANPALLFLLYFNYINRYNLPLQVVQQIECSSSLEMGSFGGKEEVTLNEAANALMKHVSILLRQNLYQSDLDIISVLKIQTLLF